MSRYASFLRLSFILAGTMRCAMQPGMCSSEIAALLSSQSKLQAVASMNYESSSFSRIFSTNDSMIAAMFLDGSSTSTNLAASSCATVTAFLAAEKHPKTSIIGNKPKRIQNTSKEKHKPNTIQTKTSRQSQPSPGLERFGTHCTMLNAWM